MADEVAVLAGGCFWCTEAVFLDVVGVKSVESGYTGGQTVNPTYKQVCGGDTGHAEAIRITFDPDVSSLRRPARHLLRDPRPDPAQPPGRRCRHPISLGDLPAGRRAARGRRSRDRARQRRTWRPGGDDDRAQGRLVSGRGLSPGLFRARRRSAIPIAMAVIPPKLQKLRKSFQARVKSAGTVATARLVTVTSWSRSSISQLIVI